MNTNTLGKRVCGGIASSSDRMRLIIWEPNENIFISKDGGNSWVEKNIGSNKSYSDIACSNDGTKIATREYGSDGTSGYILRPVDGGAAFVRLTASGASK